MKINGTEWYTAHGYRGHHQIKGSERLEIWYGYRMPVQGRSKEETKQLMALLKADGIETKLRTSENQHTGIPAGEPFLRVSDEKSIIALEKIFLENGIDLPTDRYREYGLNHILRPVKNPITPVAKKTFWSKIFGRS